MRRKVHDWNVLKIQKERNNIVFPEYQREKQLWSREMKMLLIDTIFENIDIPKLYFNLNEKNEYEVVDGQQRLWAIWEYLDDGFACSTDGKAKKFSELSAAKRRLIEDYTLQITLFEDAEENFLREHFVRLQLGLPLVSGERLNALSGAMKEFIFQDMTKHKFVKGLGIPNRRFARQTLAAQISINSFGRKRIGSFRRTRWEDLRDFFKEYEHPQGQDKTFFQERCASIISILTTLHEWFGEKAARLANRSYILSVYLIVEELATQAPDDLDEQKKTFVQFVFKLWQRLREEAQAGMDRTNRELYSFQTALSSAPGEAYQIQARHIKLVEFYEYFSRHGRIKGDRT
jgi:Protein of unknown function DUF262